MASSTEDQVGPLGPDTWYKSLHPLDVDLVGDFAGKELFAIHGDALMLYCITRAKVDLNSECQLCAPPPFGHRLTRAMQADSSFCMPSMPWRAFSRSCRTVV